MFNVCSIIRSSRPRASRAVRQHAHDGPTRQPLQEAGQDQARDLVSFSYLAVLRVLVPLRG